ncbi:hypothetical protein SS50377_24534 [Spironucleus salmonicida]|uniref:Uncharacterized protein n=1 Tax=Spironucleus salmonicida TaxID=348837 RepID=V6LNV4_9EUKA|nr:hypothetical protein SS50377_24534 [Spironucleus salmonicida]|eukprot:EST45923.1 Hypothetical protein SS50377_13901 [Spironucleus salmonicida]
MNEQLEDIIFIDEDEPDKIKAAESQNIKILDSENNQLQSPVPANITIKPITQVLLEKIVQQVFDEFTGQQEAVFNDIFQRIILTENELNTITLQSNELETENQLLADKITELVEGQAVVQIQSYIGTIKKLHDEIAMQLRGVKGKNEQFREFHESQQLHQKQLQELDIQLISIIEDIKNIQNLE